jgi:hypothetical protein
MLVEQNTNPTYRLEADNISKVKNKSFMHSTSTAHGAVLWRSVDQDSLTFIISIKIKKKHML